MRTHQPVRRLQNRRRGSALIEGTLVLLLVILSVIVVMELGITVVVYQGALERTRHAARYAVVNPSDVEGIKNVVVYGNSAGTGNPLLGLDPERVAVNVSRLDNESAVAGIEVLVQPYPLVTPVLRHGIAPIRVRVALPIETPGFVP